MRVESEMVVWKQWLWWRRGEGLRVEDFGFMSDMDKAVEIFNCLESVNVWRLMWVWFEGYCQLTSVIVWSWVSSEVKDHLELKSLDEHVACQLFASSKDLIEGQYWMSQLNRMSQTHSNLKVIQYPSMDGTPKPTWTFSGNSSKTQHKSKSPMALGFETCSKLLIQLSYWEQLIFGWLSQFQLHFKDWNYSITSKLVNLVVWIGSWDWLTTWRVFQARILIWRLHMLLGFINLQSPRFVLGPDLKTGVILQLERYSR